LEVVMNSEEREQISRTLESASSREEVLELQRELHAKFEGKHRSEINALVHRLLGDPSTGRSRFIWEEGDIEIIRADDADTSWSTDRGETGPPCRPATEDQHSPAGNVSDPAKRETRVGGLRQSIIRGVRSLSGMVSQVASSSQKKRKEFRRSRTLRADERAKSKREREREAAAERERKRLKKQSEVELAKLQRSREQEAKRARSALGPLAELHQRSVEAEMALARAVARPAEKLTVESAEKRVEQFVSAMNRERARIPQEQGSALDLLSDEFLAVVRRLHRAAADSRDPDQRRLAQESIDLTIPSLRQQLELELQRLQDRANP
jgi:hypothetical protein